MVWQSCWSFQSFLVPPMAPVEPGTLLGQGEGLMDGWTDRREGRRSQSTCCDGGAAPKNPFLIKAPASCFPTPRGCCWLSQGSGVCAGVLGHLRGGPGALLPVLLCLLAARFPACLRHEDFSLPLPPLLALSPSALAPRAVIPEPPIPCSSSRAVFYIYIYVAGG